MKRRRARSRPLHPADSQWFACKPREGKIGCITQTLSGWVMQAEKDSGMRDGVTTEERDRIKALERENRELRQANEILRKASAYFAQAEFDRPLKRWSASFTARQGITQ
jgi:transposase-like protein